MQDTNREAIRIVSRSNVNVYAENYNQTINYLQEYSTRTFPTIDKGTIGKILRGEVTPFTQIAESSIKDIANLERDLTRNLVSLVKFVNLTNETRILTGLKYKGESIPDMVLHPNEVFIYRKD